MSHSDFAIGTILFTCAGQQWRCTDVGTRVILAIELKPDLDKSWFNGPPYAVVEIPFDECALLGCYRSEDKAIKNAIDAANTSNHPGYPHEDVFLMIKERLGIRR